MSVTATVTLRVPAEEGVESVAKHLGHLSALVEEVATAALASSGVVASASWAASAVVVTTVAMVVVVVGVVAVVMMVAVVVMSKAKTGVEQCGKLHRESSSLWCFRFVFLCSKNREAL